MEFIRKALIQIQQHLGTLSASQKLLLVMFLVFVTAGFVGLLSWTATPDLVPLLDQTFTNIQIADIENKLDQYDAYYKVQGDRIMVRRQDRERLVSRLSYDGKLPEDTSENWQKVAVEGGMWRSAEDRRRLWQLAREQRLSRLIQRWPGVYRAHVIINPGSKRLLSAGPSSDPSASVYIQMRGQKKPPKRLIEAAAELVSRSVDRLTRDRVGIVVDGAAYHVSGDDSPLTDDLLDRRRAHERYMTDNIVGVLGIPNVLVGVHVELETEQIQMEQEKYGDPTVSKERESEETSERTGQDGIPGVRPNVGASVEAPAGGEKSSQRETETEFAGKRDVTRVVKRNLPGDVETVRATVNVPHSYFERIYKEKTGKGEKPTDAELEPIITTQLAEIQKKVLPVIGADDPTLVKVGWFYDTQLSVQTAGLMAAEQSGGQNLVQYAKPAGLAVLALSSLMMVLMMLRKASTGVAVPDVERPAAMKESPPVLETEGGPVGEAESMDGALQGVEIDEDSVRVRNMAEQVASLVKEDPESAAVLIKQWMAQDR